MRPGPRTALHSGMPLDRAALATFEPTDARTLHAMISRGDAGPVRMRGLYVHVPFCFHKCHYCDFYSFVETSGREGAYVDRLLVEARAWADVVSGGAGVEELSGVGDSGDASDIRGAGDDAASALETLFVGGGTPTLLEPALLARLLDGLRHIFRWRDDAEWTVEANPETVTDEIARTLLDAGVNRVSIGCQSFDPGLLKALERWHEPASVARAVERLRAAGLTDLNLDLIFAIPGETLDQWQRDLDQALALKPSHLSCYGLVYEPNTALTKRRDMGQVTPTEDDLEAAMYEHTRERLAHAGFEQYEISNWARPRRRCQHNELYWNDADWLALGPSASGHAGRLRWKNAPRLGDWLDRAPFSPLGHAEVVTDRQRSGERFMLGLRRNEGLPLHEVERLLACGSDAPLRRAAIDRACIEGLLQRDGDRLRLTDRGLLLADSVLSQLI